jgi:AraC family carnitine catabolism transcriptional activator
VATSARRHLQKNIQAFDRACAGLYPTTSTQMPMNVRFLLLPQFSMMGFLSAVEPLRVTNRFRSNSYSWQVMSVDGSAVTASNGMSLNVDSGLGAPDAEDILFVVAGFGPLEHYGRSLEAWLRRAGNAAVLGGIDTGSFVLAEAGLLDGHRLTLHWEAIASFQERYPHLDVTQELFEIDRRRITSAGGTASIDLMLELIERSHGADLAIEVSEQFVYRRIRSSQDHQRLRIGRRYKLQNKKLIHVIEAMEQHTETPLGTQVLAHEVGISSRHLERLFRIHLDETPSSFYLSLRLEKARQLLRQTDLSVLEISLACGFESSSYFARCYRTRYETSPSCDREE